MKKKKVAANPHPMHFGGDGHIVEGPHHVELQNGESVQIFVPDATKCWRIDVKITKVNCWIRAGGITIHS